MGIHPLNKGGEFRVPVDRRLDGRLVHGEIDVARAVRIEQHRSLGRVLQRLSENGRIELATT
jgi:hypothetical protein